MILIASITLALMNSGPDLQQHSHNYVGSRAPLANTPYIKLPVGSIKPRGWVREYLVRQRNGLTGQLGEISAWLQKDKNAWLAADGKGEWGWEEVPYWLKGYANLGYILGDKKVIKEARLWLESAITSQREDGNFGPTFMDDNGVEDFWPKMIMLYCLQSYYEFSGDKRVIDLMTKFFRYQLAYPEEKFMQQYWQHRRIGDNLHSVFWLYNRTGQPWLLDLARKIHRKGADWLPHPKGDEWFKGFVDWHNVNIAQGFREPTEYSLLSGETKHKEGSRAAFDYVRKYFGQVPGGMFGSDENARQGYDDPHQGVETCGLVEQMNSDQELFRMTGDPFWAGHAEDVAFNSYPAAVMPDFKSLRYLTAPNQVVSDAANHAPGIANSGPFLAMNPFGSRCCQHNHAQGWPYYAENLWMATCDNGLAAALYADCTVTAKVGRGQKVTIAESTRYPFDERIRFKVSTSQPVDFPLYLRIPAWCADAKVTVAGESHAGRPAEMLRLQRTWKDGDEVVLTLPMSIKTRTWTANKNSVSVDYGPLTFALKIGEEYRPVDHEKSAQWDSKWQKGADRTKWPAYEIFPTTPWNYALQIGDFKVEKRPWPKSNFPWTHDEVPFSIKAQGRKVPAWTIDSHGLCGEVPLSPLKLETAEESITLIPMGAARLRISAFPTVAK